MIRKVRDSGGKDDGSKNIFEGLFAEYFDLATLTLLLNLPFLAIGCRSLGTKFIARSGFSMVAFSFFLETFAPMRNATDEYLLAVCFGGIFLGVGVGLVISFGGCLDGTETVAILLNRRFDLPVGRFVLIFNIVIYMIAGFLFGFDRAMYSLLTYYITSHVLDFVESGADQAKAATIITDEGRQIAGLIYRRMGRTVTILEGEGLISGRKSVVYCVQNRFEVYELKKLIKEVDGSAFIAITAFATMAGIGGSSYMSICMGRSDRETAQKTINNALLMLAVISAVVTAAVLCFKRPLLYLLGCSDAMYPFADIYLTIYIAGTFASLTGPGLNQFILAKGYAGRGMVSVIIGALCNVALDPLFIYGFHMGIAGARPHRRLQPEDRPHHIVHRHYAVSDHRV